MPSAERPQHHGPHASAPEVASAARVYDWLLGGTHNFPVDQEAGAHSLRTFPLGAVAALYNRQFLQRAVRVLAA